MSVEALREAVSIVGGQTALAEAIGCRQGDVWKWLNIPGRDISPKYIIPIARATEWKVTPHRLASSLYPYPNDGLPEEVRQDLQNEAAA